MCVGGMTWAVGPARPLSPAQGDADLLCDMDSPFASLRRGCAWVFPTSSSPLERPLSEGVAEGAVWATGQARARAHHERRRGAPRASASRGPAPLGRRPRPLRTPPPLAHRLGAAGAALMHRPRAPQISRARARHERLAPPPHAQAGPTRRHGDACARMRNLLCGSRATGTLAIVISVSMYEHVLARRSGGILRCKIRWGGRERASFQSRDSIRSGLPRLPRFLNIVATQPAPP